MGTPCGFAREFVNFGKKIKNFVGSLPSSPTNLPRCLKKIFFLGLSIPKKMSVEQFISALKGREVEAFAAYCLGKIDGAIGKKLRRTSIQFDECVAMQRISRHEIHRVYGLLEAFYFTRRSIGVSFEGYDLGSSVPIYYLEDALPPLDADYTVNSKRFYEKCERAHRAQRVEVTYPSTLKSMRGSLWPYMDHAVRLHVRAFLGKDLCKRARGSFELCPLAFSQPNSLKKCCFVVALRMALQETQSTLRWCHPFHCRNTTQLFGAEALDVWLSFQRPPWLPELAEELLQFHKDNFLVSGPRICRDAIPLHKLHDGTCTCVTPSSSNF